MILIKWAKKPPKNPWCILPRIKQKEKANFELVEQKSEDNEAETRSLMDNAFTSKCFISSDRFKTKKTSLMWSGQVTLFLLIYF